MDSRVVNKEIRQVVWSQLKHVGFETRTARTAWRHWHDGVDVVNFQSFNAYNASVLGCTTFSFAVRLGVALSYIPYFTSVKERDGVRLPEEYECEIRRSLRKTLRQPEFEREDIWFVAADGSSLSATIADAAGVIHESLGWFEPLRNPEEVLRMLTDDEETSRTSGFGAPGSAVRNYMTGYAATRAGEHQCAITAFAALLNSGLMEEKHEQVRGALAALREESPSV
jgi:hypothetical protein